jgi:predicted RNA-binding protein (TIGR00451 family)
MPVTGYMGEDVHLPKRTSYWVLRKIRTIADYQFSEGAGCTLFPDEIDVTISRKTGKIKEIRDGSSHLATLNPRTGTLSLSIEGAKRLTGKIDGSTITVDDEFVFPISMGGNVFARHVVNAGDGLRAGNETVVVSENSSVVAVGRSLLSGGEAKGFKCGVAIKVRRGVNSQHVT